MFRFLFILFIAIPIIEIALLIQVSEVIGGFATIALVIGTAILGARLVKQQGLGAYVNVQQQMSRGQLPAQDLFTGLCVIIAGVLLMTPGIMTDVLGFLLLTPVVRKRLAQSLLAHATVRVQTGMHSGQSPFANQSRDGRADQQEEIRDPFKNQSGRNSSTTIEGEYERKD
ncbi:FxsA family protein [Pseudoalteromonas piscicida]|uniref:FxsA family protein n=1 Tax=Pseudoalteromonas piscicida TaxID=43662 RepID=UPI0027E486AC|nr:FxsA family protein [Pseudoalteromonas piscicida]WMO14877.1 FxsA family protein [Pseudoalteromonas piscicida]